MWQDPLDANRDRRRTIKRDARWRKIGILVDEELSLHSFAQNLVITSDGDKLETAADLLHWLRERADS